MPVDYLALILLVAIVACSVVAVIARPSWRWQVLTRTISLVVLLLAATALFFIYILPGLRLLPKASGGDATSQFKLGQWYQSGMNTGLFELPTVAVHWFQKAAEQLHAASQYQMGIYYSEGVGVDRNYQTAISWFEKAATNGIPEAAERADWLKHELERK